MARFILTIKGNAQEARYLCKSISGLNIVEVRGGALVVDGSEPVIRALAAKEGWTAQMQMPPKPPPNSNRR